MVRHLCRNSFSDDKDARFLQKNFTMKLPKKLSNGLARNTIWMSLGQGSRLAIQAAYFTLIARSLGVMNYGAFVGVVALVGMLYPFGSLGRGNLLIKHVARDRSSFPEMWGAALSLTALSGSFLIAFVLAISHYALPASIPWLLVLLVAASDIIGLNIILVTAQAFQSFDEMKWTASIYVMISASRLIGALLLYSIQHHPSALQWGYVYFGSTVVVTTICCWLVSTRLGRPKWNLPRTPRELREGLYFSISFCAQTIYNDIDKAMLARLSTLTATGIYGAAYRLVDVSFSPITALLYAAYPDFFRKGADGIGPSFAYAKTLLRKAVGYALLVCVAILLCAGLVPYVLGPQYAQSVIALRWLAPLPVFKAMHYFLSDTLTGAGFQGLRSALQSGVAVFNFLINLWLIPAYSWRGAAWASIASDGLLAISAGVAVFVLSRRSAPAEAVQV
jgi:O-antigen/teichoic acid export membrane protein